MKQSVSVLIPTSLIPSHPSTAIIEETIDSVRHHLPGADIYIMADGVRAEQLGELERYLDYIHNLVGKAIFSWKGIKLLPFTEHLHQVGMVRKTLELVASPLLLFVEHDTPLVKDESIPWPELSELVYNGDINLVRFLHEAHIHPEHESLMRGKLELSVPLTKTVQFSARPHLANRLFYDRLLARFSPDACCFIEDYAHSVCQTDWEEWKMTIYTPEGNCKRSYHTDGRAGSEKFSERQVF